MGAPLSPGHATIGAVDLSPQTPPVGRIAGLHRYPVKSLSGEALDALTVDERGVRGDRLWALRDPDGKLGSGKTTRRFRRMDGLLGLSARYDVDVPVVTFPDGRSVRGDDRGIHEALSVYVGRPVRLAPEEAVAHFDEGPLHLVTTSALRTLGRVRGHAVDPRHFRPNVVLETDEPGPVEDGWVGRRLAVGAEVVLEVTATMPRCVMVDLAQVDLPEEPGLLKAVADLNRTQLGVVADVVRPGTLAVGDAARLVR